MSKSKSTPSSTWDLTMTVPHIKYVAVCSLGLWGGNA